MTGCFGTFCPWPPADVFRRCARQRVNKEVFYVYLVFNNSAQYFAVVVVIVLITGTKLGLLLKTFNHGENEEEVFYF